MKKLAYLLSLIFLLAPIIGCGLLNPYKKNSEGFYERHYLTCEPIALEKAFNAFYAREGIVFVRNRAPREEISKAIQKRGMCTKEALSFFSREAVCMTWPSEIKYIAEKYGFELVSGKNLDELDPEKDIAIVLVHGKFLKDEYHWVVFPMDDVEDFYG